MDAITQLKESLSDRYEIEREIGAGGMATVYLARDIRHDRHVALKLLNPDLGAVLGVERFLAEIRVTANLQHPNLLPLFDSGAADGLLFYVMPFVEGESLRARLEREKQLPIDEAIRISVAIANALDYAHSHGVIHRDLKPENILLQAGQPVIADFGIALAVSKAGGNRITQTGLSLGTPQYMSPEQATGDRVIDGRSDIYSLGAVTYEMLTGDAPHTGSTSQAIIARMLTEKPRPMRTSRAAIPEHVELAVQHALEKLPADRFSTAHEFSEALLGRSTLTTTGVLASDRAKSSAKRSWKQRLLDPATLALAAIAIAAVGFAAMRKPTATPNRVVRFVIATPDSLRPFDNFPWPAAISPDGSIVVYTASGESGTMLYGLRTDQLEARPIPGTNDGFQPHFSPDGEWLAFESPAKLRKVRLDGSAPITIAEASGANGADWTTKDEIVLGSEGKKRGLSRVSAAGGDLVEIVKPDSAKGETDYLWPIALPNGKAAVFTVWTGTLGLARLASVSLDGGDVAYLDIKGIRPLAVIDGKLIYVQVDGAVMAVGLDGSGRHVSGRPIPVLDPVRVVAGNNGNSGIFVSPGGGLVTSRGGTKSQLGWIARDGTVTPIAKEARNYSTPSLAPDGQRIAVVVGEQDKTDIWTYDMQTGTFSRLTSTAAASSPSWSPDGSKIYFVGIGDTERFAIWSQAANGGSPAERVVAARGLVTQVAVAPDGRSILYTTYNENSWDIFRVQLDAAPVAIPYLTDATNETAPHFSPDGRWVAVASNESGREEVYIRSYPNPSSKVQISTGGGAEPAWGADGTRVFYKATGQVVMSAKLSMSPNARVIARDTVITSTSALVGAGIGTGYNVAKDGRFLGLGLKKDDFQLVVVPNWRAELEERLAGLAKR
jgi:serine/threonine protein kinase/Tol biopolymer transport system component